MMRVAIVSVVVGIPLIALLGTVAYACYACVKYTREHKR